jgi:DNA-binding NtrC family response regulator
LKGAEVDAIIKGMNGVVPPSSARVLVVDDEGSICRLVATLLESQGHRVLQAGSGSHALEMAANTPIDLLVTDVRMFGMDGLTLAREMALAHPNLRIIFMSGYFGEEDGRPESVPGIWEYIPKPFALPDLLSLVNRVLNGLVEK